MHLHAPRPPFSATSGPATSRVSDRTGFDRRSNPVASKSRPAPCLVVLAWLAAATIPGHGAPRATGLDHQLRGTPEPPPPYRSEPAFSGRAINQLVAFAFEPGTNDLIYTDQEPGTKGSRLRRLGDRVAADAVTLLEEAEETLYSLAFHPRYRENGQFFLSLFGPASAERDQRRMQVRRYRMLRDGSGKIENPAGELIIEWQTWGHTGGAMAFDEAGFFYVTTGDGTGDSDTKLAGQDLSHLLAKVLRLDVDRPSPDRRPYSVPADNPFQGEPGVRPETFAYGLRNPWRMSWDPVLKRLWVGNNGQDRLEQVYLIKPGANYGWSVYEGSGLFYAARPLGPHPVSPPTLEHGHEEARSLTGGLVYSGRALPDLTGAYIYGDYSTGKIWAARHDGKKVTWRAEIADTTLAIADFGTDPVTGDLLVAHHGNDKNGGGLHRLVPNPPDPAARPFPRRLSETGLFSDTAAHLVREPCLPYEVAVPQWADGAESERFLALPKSEPRIGFTPQRGWNFPDGAVAFQTLTREGRRLETRVMVKQAGEWGAYSYAWNEAQTDATLVPAAGATIDTGNGMPWKIPGRADCLQCHSRAANFTLGLQTAQMNRQIGLGAGEMRNQLDHWRELGWFATAADSKPEASSMREAADHYERLVDPFDESVANIDLRARSYLHGRCSHCHVEAGGGNSTMDLRISVTDPMLSRVIDHEPVHGNLDLTGSGIRLVAPGDPSRSVLFNRISTAGRGRMPPVGSEVPDPQGVALLTRWILGLQAP